MIKRSSDYLGDLKENMRGGEGVIKIEHLLTQSEMYDNGRLFAKITVEPGDSIGFHVHEGKMETYYGKVTSLRSSAILQIIIMMLR